ncbi:MAG: sialidase family protein [Nitrososphaera sp.]
MKAQGFKRIGSISFSTLLISSLFLIANSSSSSASSTVSDEVAAASGSNRFVVWSDSTPGNQEIFFRRSADNGVTWQPKVNLSNNPGNSNIPLIRASGANVYVVWRQESASGSGVDIFLRQSPDNGVTWKSPINISKSIGNSYSHQLAVSGSNAYVTWQDDTFGKAEVLLRRSTDNGATWKPYVNISNNPGDSELPQIVAAGSNVYVTWDDRGTGEILLRRSTDSGATWKSVENLSSNPGGSTIPRIAVSASKVYVVWEQTSAKATAVDVFFRRSTDNGVTWQSKVNVSNDGASGAPEITVAGSNVYVLYQGNGVDIDILFRRSTDNGATWKPKLNLSNDAEQSHHYKIAAAGSNVYVVWNDLGAGSDPPDVLFRRSVDNGATWKSVTNLSNNPTNSLDPQVIAIGSEVYVVWSDLVSLNYDILLKRSTSSGATWNPLKNLSNNGGSSFGAQIAV